jgi:hypothetical protein
MRSIVFDMAIHSERGCAPLFPFLERLVTVENAFQCFIDDPIPRALDELAIEFEVAEDGTAQGDSSLLLCIFGLF